MALYLAVDALRCERFLRSALWVGLKIALKPFTAVFFALFVCQKRWAAAAAAVGAAVIIYGLSYLFLTHGISFEWTPASKTAAFYKATCVVENEGLPFGHSAFGLWKTLLLQFRGQNPATTATIVAATTPYMIGTGLVYVAVLVFLHLKPRDLWRQVSVIVCLQSLLPYVAAEYRLMHFVTAALFLRREPPCKRDALYITLFGLILIPKDYYHFNIVLSGLKEVTTNAVLTPAPIAALLVACVAESDRSIALAELPIRTEVPGAEPASG